MNGPLNYVNPHAAIRWLEAIGFEQLTRNGDAHLGTEIVRLVRNDVVIEVGQAYDEFEMPSHRRDEPGARTVATDDVSSIYSAALRAGGTSLDPPAIAAPGMRAARVLDTGGYEWTFVTMSD